MSWLGLRRRTPAPGAARRNYAAADTGRLFSHWLAMPDTADELLRRGLRTMRGRARELALNNDWVKGWLRRARINVVGAAGIRLQSRALTADGEVDAALRTAVEAAWTEWGRLGACTVCGTYTFRDLEVAVIDALNRDGEALLRKVRGWDNGFGFALQIMESDHLDEDLVADLPNGNRIVMGVELDPWRRPAAYHLLRRHPGDRRYAPQPGERYQRVPADEIVHVYRPWRPTQTRGVPEMHSAMARLRMIGGYEEAALVAARVGASKMGFYTETEADAATGSDPRDEGATTTDQDGRGNLLRDAAPGHFEVLPPGVDFTAFDPGYPNEQIEAFQKHMLRGAGIGMGVSYHGLTGDLSEVNYSSLRQGALDERDVWAELQRFFIDRALEPIFAEWLPLAAAAGGLAIPIEALDRARPHLFQPRGWEWVDPLKEIEADAKAIALGTKSRTRICADRGVDFEDVLAELAAEEALAAQYGVKLAAPEATPPAPRPSPPDEPEKPE
jgi:lambda family phage portal protein